MDLIGFARQFKMGPFAIFDTALAYVGIYLLAPFLTKLFLKFHVYIPRISWIWLTLPIAVLFHLIFHQNTPFMKLLFDKNTFYLPLIVLLIMLFMGVRRIKKQPIPSQRGR